MRALWAAVQRAPRGVMFRIGIRVAVAFLTRVVTLGAGFPLPGEVGACLDHRE
jgi:hypothetical protein